MRDEFDKWALSLGYGECAVGSTEHTIVETAWEAWQAGQQALISESGAPVVITVMEAK